MSESAVSARLTALGLSEEAIGKLVEMGLSSEAELPFIQEEDLTNLDVPVFKARRIVAELQPKVEAPPSVVSAGPTKVEVSLTDNEPIPLEKRTLSELLDLLDETTEIGPREDFTKTDVAAQIDRKALGYGASVIVLADDGKIDRDKTRACFEETKTTGQAQSSWEGAVVRSASSLIEGVKRTRCPLFGDTLTANFYNNGKRFSWLPVVRPDGNEGDPDLTWLAVVAYAKRQGHINVRDGREAGKLVKELSPPREDWWKGMKAEFDAQDERVRRSYLDALVVQPQAPRSSRPDPMVTTSPPRMRSPVRTTRSSYSGNKDSQLADLFADLFTDSGQMRRFVGRMHRGDMLAGQLPGGSTPTGEMSWAISQLLTRRGETDRALFEALVNEAPGCYDSIKGVAQQFGVRL